MCVGVCVWSAWGHSEVLLGCVPLAPVWLQEDTPALIPRLPAHLSVYRCSF